jgi:hypothetical protein
MYDEVGVPASEADINRMGSWGINLTRWWLMWWHMPNDITPEVYRQFIEERCNHLDTLIPAFRRNGIKVCLVMGSYPGGKLVGAIEGKWDVHRMFRETAWQDEFVRTWEYIAARYKDEETVVMYDLMNEPSTGTMPNVPGLLTQPELFLKTAQAIRALGDETEIVFETPNDIFESLKPFDVPGIIYSVHVYYPHVLTHQGLSDDWPVGPVYPGILENQYWEGGEKPRLENEYWDAARLRDHYSDVKRFADTYKARIFVGEFGCARWAPGNSAYRYLKDCLEYFEEEGWDYMFFSLEPTPEDCSYMNWGATMWSPEYDTVFQSSCPVYETDRLTLFKSYWARNKKNYEL